MNDDITRAELVQLRIRVAQLETKQRSRPYVRHAVRRFFPLAIVGLLVALMPLSILAAPVFSDLGTAAPVHQPNIQAIGDAGITTGFEDPADPTKRLYNPKDLVTREEMASFLARTAGLGANPPVANAKTLDGLAPNALTRIAFAEELSDTFLGVADTLDILTVTLEVPVQSFVLVTFAGNAVSSGATGCPCVMRGQLGVDGAGFTTVTNTNLATEAADLVGSFDRRPIAGSRVYLVTPGSHTFTVRLSRQAGTNTAIGTSNLTLQAILHPFGSTGATAASGAGAFEADEGSDR